MSALLNASRNPGMNRGLDGGFQLREPQGNHQDGEDDGRGGRTPRRGRCRVRNLELTTVSHTCAKPGRYTVAIKVIDIFGNDTMTLVEVTVGDIGIEKNRVSEAG